MLRLKQSGVCEVVVPASPDAIWQVLTDVGRVGEWSIEARAGEWLDEHRGVGARFRGPNKRGLARWTKICTVQECDAPRRFVFHTAPARTDPGATAWEFDLVEVEGGTRIRQSFRILEGPRWFEAAISLLIPAHVDRTAELRADLERLGRVAAAHMARAEEG
jgi:hypothetical protein